MAPTDVNTYMRYIHNSAMALNAHHLSARKKRKISSRRQDLSLSKKLRFGEINMFPFIFVIPICATTVVFYNRPERFSERWNTESPLNAAECLLTSTANVQSHC